MSSDALPHAAVKRSSNGRLVVFAEFILDLNSGELFNQGKRVELQGQPFDLLAALLEKPGELILREDLRKKIWTANTTTDFDHGINRAVNKIRKALGDSAENPRFVETLSRRGYRFIGSVRPEDHSEPASESLINRGEILIGRGAELEQLRRLLDSAQAGRGAFVLIAGEPGIGKTHLTRAALSEAARRGFSGVVGHSYEAEGASPYTPFVEILESCARVTPRHLFRSALGESAPWIAKLMPELPLMFSGSSAPREFPPEQQRRVLFNAYCEFVERSARLNPIAAVLEDLQWADEPTLLLLTHLARMVYGLPVLLIGTYRNVELHAAEPFTRSLETWMREKLIGRVTLHRLDLNGVHEMLTALTGKEPPFAVAGKIFHKTEGNPFFVEELMRHLLEETRLFDAAGEWRSELKAEEWEVPAGVRLVIGRRFERLRKETRQILTVAAVVGRSFSLGLLQAIEGDDSENVIEALEEAERAHLVTPEPPPREIYYRFVHELVRQAFTDALSMPRRQQLHGRIAKAIERLNGGDAGAQASELAHHLYRAGPFADLNKTVACLLAAAHQATSAAAHEEALDKARLALSLIAGKRHPLQAAAELARAVSLRSLARIPEAVQSYESAIALLVEAGNLTEAAEASLPLAYIHLWKADGSSASAVVERAVGFIGLSSALLLKRLLLLKSMSLAVTGEMQGSWEALSEAQKVHPLAADPSEDGFASMCEARILFESARLSEADSCARRATQRFRATGDLWGEAETFEAIAAPLWLGRVRELEHSLPEALARAERVGHLNAVWAYKAFLGSMSLAFGNLEEAELFTQAADDFAAECPGGWSFLNYLMHGIIANYRGKLAVAASWFRKGLAAEPKSYQSGQFSGGLFWTLAAGGDAAASAALTAARLHLPIPGRALSLGSVGCLALILEGLAFLGRREEAAALEAHAEYVVANGPLCVYSQHLFQTSAGIASACAGHWARAEEHHQTAIHQADSSPYSVAQPAARWWYAEMLLSRNRGPDCDAARGLMNEALSMYRSMAMTWHVDRTTQRLAAVNSVLEHVR